MSENTGVDKSDPEVEEMLENSRTKSGRTKEQEIIRRQKLKIERLEFDLDLYSSETKRLRTELYGNPDLGFYYWEIQKRNTTKKDDAVVMSRVRSELLRAMNDALSNAEDQLASTYFTEAMEKEIDRVREFFNGK